MKALRIARRGDHPSVGGAGYCRRCGCNPITEKRCPPGYWMTPRELEKWSALSDDARTAMERRLSPDRQRTTAAKNGGSDGG